MRNFIRGIRVVCVVVAFVVLFLLLLLLMLLLMMMVTQTMVLLHFWLQFRSDVDGMSHVDCLLVDWLPCIIDYTLCLLASTTGLSRRLFFIPVYNVHYNVHFQRVVLSWSVLSMTTISVASYHHKISGFLWTPAPLPLLEPAQTVTTPPGTVGI